MSFPGLVCSGSCRVGPIGLAHWQQPVPSSASWSLRVALGSSRGAGRGHCRFESLETQSVVFPFSCCQEHHVLVAALRSFVDVVLKPAAVFPFLFGPEALYLEDT